MAIRTASIIQDLQRGDRLYLRHSPDSAGTVILARPDGSFRVAFDSRGRKPGEPRTRIGYARSQRPGFRRGRAPVPGSGG